MLAGRNMLIDAKLAQWADEGQQWLYETFGRDKLDFHTMWSAYDRTITLEVRPADWRTYVNFHKRPILTETEPAERFASYALATKIALIAGGTIAA